MSLHRHIVVCIGVALIAMTAGACGSSSGGSSGSTSAPTSSTSALDPQTAATAFLSGYVTDDGRVLRKDQGNDIVSEGQAYGMLIAELAGRDDLTRTIWQWTTGHLLRPDGLIAFHADENGNVVDPASASDADILTAYALLRYDGGEAPTLHAAGRRLARAVLATETATAPDGGLVPVAGSWTSGPEAVVDPSYFMTGVFTALAALTHDQRWQVIASTTVTLVRTMTNDGQTLPPDWARLTPHGLTPISAPSGSAGVQYGFDAQRVPLWFANGCSASARALAGSWWQILQHSPASGAIALRLDGSPINGAVSTVPYLASAATARAAGDVPAADSLTSQAAAANQAAQTYYGSAWLALAPAVADGTLSGCH